MCFKTIWWRNNQFIFELFAVYFVILYYFILAVFTPRGTVIKVSALNTYNINLNTHWLCQLERNVIISIRLTKQTSAIQDTVNRSGSHTARSSCVLHRVPFSMIIFRIIDHKQRKKEFNLNRTPTKYVE